MSLIKGAVMILASGAARSYAVRRSFSGFSPAWSRRFLIQWSSSIFWRNGRAWSSWPKKVRAFFSLSGLAICSAVGARRRNLPVEAWISGLPSRMTARMKLAGRFFSKQREIKRTSVVLWLFWMKARRILSSSSSFCFCLPSCLRAAAIWAAAARMRSWSFSKAAADIGSLLSKPAKDSKDIN